MLKVLFSLINKTKNSKGGPTWEMASLIWTKQSSQEGYKLN